LLKRLNAGEYSVVPYELSRWVYGGGVKLPGLVRRRNEEGILFRDGIYTGVANAPVTVTPNPTPSPTGNITWVNFTGTVGSSNGVNLRNSTRFSDRSSRNEPNGKRLEFDAWTYGEVGTDMWNGNQDARWFKVKGTNLWVPSAYIDGNAPGSSPMPTGGSTLPRTGGGDVADINIDPNFEEAARVLSDKGADEHGAKKEKVGFLEMGWQRLIKSKLYDGADFFEAGGSPDAARHMRHYLDNTGETLNVNVNHMLRDLPDFKKLFETEIALAREDANARIAAGNKTQPMHFSLGSQWDFNKKHYADFKNKGNWYWAMGGFYYRYIAVVETIPPLTPDGEITVRMTTRIHVFDRYNWDGGKSVTIVGLKITDETLAELHKVGIAKEYNINGSSSPVTTTWTYPNSSSAKNFPVTGDREGGRTDPRRNR